MFKDKDSINFNNFLKIFSLKSNSQYNEIDVKNSFRLLSKEYEKPGFIHLDRVKEILEEMGLQDVEIMQLTNQLNNLTGTDGKFDFEKFVGDAFWNIYNILNA